VSIFSSESKLLVPDEEPISAHNEWVGYRLVRCPQPNCFRFCIVQCCPDAAFAPTSGFTMAAKRGDWRNGSISIDPDNTAIKSPTHAMSASNVTSKYPAGQAERGIVCHCNRLIFGFE